MTIKLPRGAIPTPRSELAASEPYLPEQCAEIFVPSGNFPSPNQELAVAHPYNVYGTAPESFIIWPIAPPSWINDKTNGSFWAEEAFAKACAYPQVFIPSDIILSTLQKCGSSNFAAFMQKHGFQIDGKAYLDGDFNSVDWANAATLNFAIANVGPVKIGIALANFASVSQSRITPETSGWATYGLPAGQSENHCASLCGYGHLTALIDLFALHGIRVNLPSGMPAGLCYAMFTGGSIGIIDWQSLMNITGEAWVRNPTTIVQNVDNL